MLNDTTPVNFKNTFLLYIKRNEQIRNKILLDYYRNNLRSKNKKFALITVMYKIVNYIFATLKNQNPYGNVLNKFIKNL